MARTAQWDALLASGDPGTPTEAQLARIQELSPTVLEASQVYVRTMAVANDGYDRRDNRFTVPILQRLADTLAGKALLVAHNTENLPVGAVFAARLRPAVGEEPGTTVLEADFFLPKTEDNQSLRMLIDTGIVRHVSVTCSYDRYECDICAGVYGDCPHFRGETLGDGRVVRTHFAGDPLAYEAHEVSLCHLGVQREARITHSDTEDPLVSEITEQLAKLTAQIQRLGASHTVENALEADGKAYRQALLAEISASHSLLGESATAEPLLAQLAEASASILIPIRDHLNARVKAALPPGATGTRSTASEVAAPRAFSVL